MCVFNSSHSFIHMFADAKGELRLEGQALYVRVSPSFREGEERGEGKGEEWPSATFRLVSMFHIWLSGHSVVQFV